MRKDSMGGTTHFSKSENFKKKSTAKNTALDRMKEVRNRINKSKSY